MANHISFTFDDHLDGKEYSLAQDYDDVMGRGTGLMCHGHGDNADVVFHISKEDAVALARWILREYGHYDAK